MERKSIKVNNVNDVLFLISLGTYLFFTVLNASFYAQYIPGFIYKASFIGEVLLLFLKESINKKYKIREWFFLFIVLILTIIIYINLSGQLVILPLFLFIYSARNVDLTKIINLAFYESLVLFIIIVISAKIGLITNYIEKGSRVREYLGFRYSLYTQALLFNIISLDLYRNKQKRSIIKPIIWFLISFAIFKVTDARLSFYLSTILIVSSIFLPKNLKKKTTNKHRIIGFLCCSVFILCFAGSLYITYNFDSSDKRYSYLDDFLGNRLSYGKQALNEYGINLFGHKIDLVGNGLSREGLKNTGKYNYVDCLYIILLLRYGTIFMISFIIMLTLTNRYLLKKKEYYVLLVMVIYAFHGVLDDLMIHLYYNTFWLVIGNIILNKNNLEEKGINVYE